MTLTLIKKTAYCEPDITQESTRVSILTFHIYCTLCVKFRAASSDQLLMLLSICEFCENRRREGRNFLMDLREIISTPKT